CHGKPQHIRRDCPIRTTRQCTRPACTNSPTHTRLDCPLKAGQASDNSSNDSYQQDGYLSKKWNGRGRKRWNRKDKSQGQQGQAQSDMDLEVHNDHKDALALLGVSSAYEATTASSTTTSSSLTRGDRSAA